MNLQIINEIVNTTFVYCVDLLFLVADLLGTTYEMINIVLFVILFPLVMVIQSYYIVYLRGKIYKLK
jgi:hypothetical protein